MVHDTDVRVTPKATLCMYHQTTVHAAISSHDSKIEVYFIPHGVRLYQRNIGMRTNSHLPLLISAWYLSALIFARSYESSLQSIAGLILELGTAQITLKTSNSPKGPPLSVSRYSVPLHNSQIWKTWLFFSFPRACCISLERGGLFFFRRVPHVALSRQFRVDGGFSYIL